MVMCGAITEVPGTKVGHYTDKEAIPACTVILFGQGAVAGVDVSGSAPREPWKQTSSNKEADTDVSSLVAAETVAMATVRAILQAETMGGVPEVRDINKC